MNRKFVFTASVGILLLMSVTLTVFAGPEKENGRWYYREENGSRVNNKMIRIDGGLYYFGSDGTLAMNRAVETGGNTYYCGESGRCLTGQWKKCAVPGENTESWHYFLENGRAFENGWLQVGKEKYHFTERSMDCGWYSEETGSGMEAVYYLGTEEDGKAVTGWLAWKGEDTGKGQEHPAGWYYFSENGRMICDTELTVGSETYAFNTDGTMAVGFCRVTSGIGETKEKYFDRRTGRRAEGWVYLYEEGGRKEGWYYFSGGEASVPGKCTKKIADEFGASLIDGSWYGFDGTGRMITGLYRYGKKYFCFGTDGKMMTGVVTVPEGETDAPGEQMLFSDTGSSPPSLGASAEGIVNGYLYRSGCKAVAENDDYEQIELISGENRQYYVVDRGGKVIRSGTVTLQGGRKMKISRQEDGWRMVPVQD